MDHAQILTLTLFEWLIWYLLAGLVVAALLGAFLLMIGITYWLLATMVSHAGWRTVGVAVAALVFGLYLDKALISVTPHTQSKTPCSNAQTYTLLPPPTLPPHRA